MSRMLSRIVMLAALALVAGGLSGCGGEPSKSGGQEQGQEEKSKQGGSESTAAKLELIYYDIPG